jgi:asparagine synthase (glutamine-hydrolysing)
MSGIFGICELDRELRSELLLPMFRSQTLDRELARDVHGGRDVAFGVARRWSFQQLAVEEGLIVAADADLIDLKPIADVLSLSVSAVADIPVAQLLARLYRRKGPDFLKLLHGGFSLALWDQNEKRLMLAIDRMGIRSLYRRRERERLYFASRIGAIRAVQQGAPEANPSAILQFLLFSAVPAPLSSDQGTEKLRPGTSVTFSSSAIVENQYWDFSYPENSNRSVAYWSKELREAIRGAVHRHLDRCEPSASGCFLSGGTDSSSVVAFASEKHHPVQSFSIAFEEAGYSEIEYSRTTSAAFHTKHNEKFLKPPDAAAAIERILDYYDEPFANSSAVGSYYCAQLAKDHGVTTLLAGDGGDELFAGNERYAKDRQFALYHALPFWLRHGVLEPVADLIPFKDGKLSLPGKYIRRAKMPNPLRILSYGFFLSYPPEDLFDEKFLAVVGREKWLSVPQSHFTRANASSELNRILYLDMKMTLADNDLKKVSGTAELAGVNVRYPFLDTQLADFAGRIPANLKLKGFKKRFIFKEAMKSVLPQKVLQKKKHGFGVPLAEWLLQEPRMKELMHDVMHDARTRQRGYFRPEFFDRLMKLHSQQANFYGEIVWYLLALELWHRKHLEQTHESVHVS